MTDYKYRMWMNAGDCYLADSSQPGVLYKGTVKECKAELHRRQQRDNLEINDV